MRPAISKKLGSECMQGLCHGLNANNKILKYSSK